jgi:signal transduction histidine kinase
MSLFSYSILITSLLSFVLSAFVFLRDRRTSSNVLWALVSFSVGIWGFGLFNIINSRTENDAIFWNKILYLGAIFTPIFYYHFVSLFLKVVKKYLLVSLYVVSLFFLMIDFFSTSFISGAPPMAGFAHWLSVGYLYYVFVVFFVSVVLLSFVEIIVNYKVTIGLQRQQLRYILVAGLIGFIGGSTNFLPQLFGWYPFGSYFTFVYVLVVSYAILKYRLMDIRMMASKIYFYMLIAAFSFIYFHLVLLVDVLYLGGIYTSLAIIVGLGFSIIFSLTFLPLLNKVQKSSDALFFKGNNPREILKDLSLQLSSSIELQSLLVTLSSVFKHVLAAELLDVYLLREIDKRATWFSIFANKTKKIKIGKELRDAILKEDRVVLVRDELEHLKRSTLAGELSKLSAKVVAPLVLRDKVIGLIFLGDKLDGDAYTQEDIEFLEIISSQAAVAIENARLYDEVSTFNSTLQQKVDEQTKDITKQAEHLKKLMDMRSEFLDITSHQLRTPVSVIKGVLSMLEEGSIPPERIKEFITGAMEKSIKLGETISDILRASEMDSDKFILTLRPIDLTEMLVKLQEDKRRTAEMKNIKMIYKIPKKLPLVSTDPKYAEHALINMLNNALQYTVAGSITTSAEVTPTHVIIRVADTGIGIPPEEREKMFTKFGRAKNAVTTFTDGTGLGLYIIKEIVEANPGAKIEIEKSEVGKGTTFALWFPLAKEVPVAV